MDHFLNYSVDSVLLFTQEMINITLQIIVENLSKRKLEVRVTNTLHEGIAFECVKCEYKTIIKRNL